MYTNEQNHSIAKLVLLHESPHQKLHKSKPTQIHNINEISTQTHSINSV